MKSKLTVVGDYLRAELLDRETVEETQEFLRALVAEGQARRLSKALVVVRSSRAIFQVQQYQLPDVLKDLAGNRSVRIALVSDDSEVHSAHQYIELLAQQHGVSVRAFRDEPAAVQWLAAEPAAP
jgi:hypothetical protein